MGKFSKVYGTALWQKIREAKLQSEPLCEYCPPNRRKPATEVDHYKPLSSGVDPYDWSNLRSTCHECHSQKTKRGERLHGCDENGWPRDPESHWNKK